MKLDFSIAKDGSKTVSANGFYLHSSYRPFSEAQRFVQSTDFQFSPQFFVFIGLALPYPILELRQKFPDSKIISFCFNKEFVTQSEDLLQRISGHDIFFVNDAVSAQNIADLLFGQIGEESAFLTQTLEWAPCGKAFSEETEKCWEGVRLFLKKSTTLLHTRAYFNRRWFLNTVKFFRNTANFVIPEKSSKPVLIAASGASLVNSIEHIRKNRNKLTLLAVSSAISPLLHYNIVPDLCISTDGGFWATKHLAPYAKDSRLTNVPLVLSAESACPSSILKSAKIIPLCYGDGPESVFFEYLQIPSVKGKRNGTVSGTALEFAKCISDKKIYFCGLDLASSEGFAHTQPNQLEIQSSIADIKISSQENRIIPQTFFNESLDIYRNWFSNQGNSQQNTFARLVSNKDKLSSIGNVEDINWNSISFGTKEKSENPEKIIVQEIVTNKSEINQKILDLIHDFPDKNILMETSAFAESILLKRKMENDEELTEKIQSLTKDLLEKAEKLCRISQ